MLRRFNYTNRVRILHEDAHFSLRADGGGWSFDAALNLDEYGLPADALVCVEAYRQTTWMRFDYGTVGERVIPASRRLSEFDSPEDIRFRVRITSRGTEEDPHGLLLAEADRVRLRSPEDQQEQRQPLLPVLPSDLGPELWRVEFTDRPRLLLNSAAGNYKQIGLEPGFVAVVYPAALREILSRILHREKYRDYDDPDDWRSRWLRFAVSVLGVGEPPESEADEDEIDEWVDDAAKAFAQKHGLLEKFKSFWTEDEKT